MPDFRHVRVGDTVTRMLAGTIPQELEVTGLTDDFIICGVPGQPDAEGWKFNRDVGYEVDEELGWGVIKDGRVVTGSILKDG